MLKIEKVRSMWIRKGAYIDILNVKLPIFLIEIAPLILNIFLYQNWFEKLLVCSTGLFYWN